MLCKRFGEWEWVRTYPGHRLDIVKSILGVQGVFPLEECYKAAAATLARTFVPVIDIRSNNNSQVCPKNRSRFQQGQFAFKTHNSFRDLQTSSHIVVPRLNNSLTH